jgi:hypothetical protein
MDISEDLAADIDCAARLPFEARYVVALTGAGMSLESGIPPFRGPGGPLGRRALGPGGTPQRAPAFVS